MTKRIAILYSGGLDSVLLRFYAAQKEPDAEIKCVYWDHGHIAAQGEIQSLPSDVDVRKVDWLNLPVAGHYLPRSDDHNKGSIYIPGRNLVFLVLTACQELPDEIWYGVQFEESNRNAIDKNEIFRHMASAICSYTLQAWKREVRIRAPFVDEKWTKIKTLRWALENGISRDELIGCVSCYYPSVEDGQVRYCGGCSQCLRRFVVFGAFGFDELHKTKQHPLCARGTQGRDWLVQQVRDMDQKGWAGCPILDELIFDFIPNYYHAHEDLFMGDLEMQQTVERIERYLNGAKTSCPAI